MSNELSNFFKVHEFNTKFGSVTNKTPQFEIFDKNPDLVKFRMSLIEEEVKELQDGVKNKNLIEVVDALSDILYVVYGMGSAIGVNLDMMFNNVHDSNMSKLCKNENDAIETVEWYKKQYALKKQPYDSPNYRLGIDGTYYVVYNESTGKILKSIYYTEAHFDDLLENDQKL